MGSIAHRHEAESPPTPGALARVRVLVSRTVVTYSAPSAPLAGTSRLHRSAAYTRCLSCAGAPKRPASGSGLSLHILCWHAALFDHGSSTSLSSRTTTSTRPSSRVERLGTPKTPAIRFTRAMNFAASWFTHLLRPASLLALLYGSDQIAPAIEGFYIQAFGRSVTLPTAGYDYNSDWTPCMGLFLSRTFSRAA